MLYENENECVADVEGESPLCWESEGSSDPGRQLICTPAASRRAFFSTG